jgi:hypothetical protein
MGDVETSATAVFKKERRVFIDEITVETAQWVEGSVDVSGRLPIIAETKRRTKHSPARAKLETGCQALAAKSMENAEAKLAMRIVPASEPTQRARMIAGH